MNRSDMLSFSLAAENFIDGCKKKQKRVMSVWVDKMNSDALIVPEGMEKVTTVLGKISKLNWKHPDLSKAIKLFLKKYQEFRDTFKLQLENEQMKRMLEWQIPYIAEREEKRGIRRYSKLSVAHKIDTLLEGRLDARDEYRVLARLCMHQYKCVRQLLKPEGRITKKQKVKLLKLMNRAGLDAKHHQENGL